MKIRIDQILVETKDIPNDIKEYCKIFNLTAKYLDCSITPEFYKNRADIYNQMIKERLLFIYQFSMDELLSGCYVYHFKDRPRIIITATGNGITNWEEVCKIIKDKNIRKENTAKKNSDMQKIIDKCDVIVGL